MSHKISLIALETNKQGLLIMRPSHESVSAALLNKKTWLLHGDFFHCIRRTLKLKLHLKFFGEVEALHGQAWDILRVAGGADLGHSPLVIFRRM